MYALRTSDGGLLVRTTEVDGVHELSLDSEDPLAAAARGQRVPILGQPATAWEAPSPP